MPDWLDWSQRLAAIAQTGLFYTQDPYDKQRYEQIREIAAEIAAAHTAGEAAAISDLFAHDSGYATPKVDVRAAIFEGDKVLLVREISDGGWTLPGGWADVGEPPSVGVVREVREEAGYECHAVRLLAVYDHRHPRHGHTFYMYHLFKLFFLCELTGGEPTTSIETDGVGFFPVDDLPELSVMRVTAGQIRRLYVLSQDPTLPADFD
jgi:ADP-ribose pyrophosphatase YjhB (NUDIX family)